MKFKLFLLTFSCFALVGIFLPQTALAGGEPANFSWLVGIPGVQGGGFNQYINALYALAISLAALIAVIKIVIAGAKYMMDDIVTHKSEAKQDIKNALIGLLIVIGAVIILNTINTDLTNVQVDATPATVNDDPLQFVDRFANQCNDAISQNSQCSSITCSSFVNSNITDAWCREICRTVYGGYMDYTGINECYFIQATADQCDAQGTRQCCESVQGGTWDSANSSCTGLEAALANRISECYRDGNTWNDSAGTCTTVQCNQNTDIRCCSARGGTLTGGQCTNGTDQSNCEGRGDIWNSTSQTCTPRVVTDPNNCGAGYLWDSGLEVCRAVTSSVALPAQAEDCRQSDGTYDVGCVNTSACFSPYVFNPGPPPQCVTF